MTLRASMLFGAKWSAISLLAMRVLGFATNLVLARLLVPEMFGLVAAANAAMATLGFIREAGIGSAYIQRGNTGTADDARAEHTMFWIAFGLNLALFVALQAATGPIAGFFDEPGLKPVLHAVFFCFLFDAVESAPRLILTRSLKFGAIAAADLVRSGANAIVAISLAFAGWGVWSLVAGQLAGRAISTLLVYLLARWVPRRAFDLNIARSLFAYGKFMWAFVIVSAIGNSLDQVFIGKWFGAASLGLYFLAFALCRMPAVGLGLLVNKIGFPVLARVRGDSRRVARGFLQALHFIAVLVLPLSFGLCALAEGLVLVLYGETWYETAAYIRILAFYGGLLAISSVTGPVFKAVGRPQILLYTSLLHHPLRLGLFFGFAGWGVTGICWAMLLSTALSTAVAIVLVCRELRIEWVSIRAALVPPTLASLGICGLLAASAGRAAGSIELLVFATIGGAMVYAILLRVLDRKRFSQLIALFRDILRSNNQDRPATPPPAASPQTAGP